MYLPADTMDIAEPAAAAQDKASPPWSRVPRCDLMNAGLWWKLACHGRTLVMPTSPHNNAGSAARALSFLRTMSTLAYSISSYAKFDDIWSYHAVPVIEHQQLLRCERARIPPQPRTRRAPITTRRILYEHALLFAYWYFTCTHASCPRILAQEFVQNLESIVIHWTRQIKDVVNNVVNNHDNSLSGEDSGPLEEIEVRCCVLTVKDEHLPFAEHWESRPCSLGARGVPTGFGHVARATAMQCALGKLRHTSRTLN